MLALLSLAGLAACGGSPSIHAAEVYDIPPPPAQRTLQLTGDVPTGLTLGSYVSITHGGVVSEGDLVDQALDPPSLTVYVPEARADAILEASGALTVVRRP